MYMYVPTDDFVTQSRVLTHSGFAAEASCSSQNA